MCLNNLAGVHLGLVILELLESPALDLPSAWRDALLLGLLSYLHECIFKAFDPSHGFAFGKVVALGE